MSYLSTLSSILEGNFTLSPTSTDNDVGNVWDKTIDDIVDWSLSDEYDIREDDLLVSNLGGLLVVFSQMCEKVLQDEVQSKLDGQLMRISSSLQEEWNTVKEEYGGTVVDLLTDGETFKL